MRYSPASFGDFSCIHCDGHVCSGSFSSGVQNRNHCPYCLWSRHLDLFAAGDRLSACKAAMQPIALTTKRSRNKYRRNSGELMLVHICSYCGEIALNRIAADDDAETLLDIFSASSALSSQILSLLRKKQISILPPDSLPLIEKQLFGQVSLVY